MTRVVVWFVCFGREHGNQNDFSSTFFLYYYLFMYEALERSTYRPRLAFRYLFVALVRPCVVF